jgi:hypothetical protein
MFLGQRSSTWKTPSWTQVQELELYRDVLPRKKRGPEPNLGEAKKAEARRLIQSYQRNGMTIKFAVTQAAQNFKVTPGPCDDFGRVVLQA